MHDPYHLDPPVDLLAGLLPKVRIRRAATCTAALALINIVDLFLGLEMRIVPPAVAPAARTLATTPTTAVAAGIAAATVVGIVVVDDDVLVILADSAPLLLLLLRRVTEQQLRQSRDPLGQRFDLPLQLGLMRPQPTVLVGQPFSLATPTLGLTTPPLDLLDIPDHDHGHKESGQPSLCPAPPTRATASTGSPNAYAISVPCCHRTCSRSRTGPRPAPSSRTADAD